MTGAAVFAGFTVSSYIGGTLSYIAAAVLAACAVFCSVKLRRRPPAFVFTALAAAFLIYGIYGSVFIESVHGLYDTTRTVSAKVISADNTGSDSVRITASGTADGVPVKFSFFYTDIGVRAGDCIEAEATFSRPVDTASYNSVYSYSDGVFVRAAVKSFDITHEGADVSIAGILSQCREHIKDIVKSHIGGDDAGLILAVFFGDRSGLSPEMSEGIRKSGLSHMTAVSGLHISLMIVTIVSAIDIVGPGKKRRLKFAAAVILAVIFMLFFNMTASVRRSGIMMIFYYGSLLARRKPSPLNSLGAAVFVILMFEPCACRDPGLILSVCGTFGAGVLAPAICEHYKLHERLRGVIAAVCATYCTIPATALFFDGVSLLSPLTSVVVYPFFMAVMVLILALLLSGGALGAAAAVPAAYCARPMVRMIKLAYNIPYGYIRTDRGIMLPFLVISAVFVTAAVLISRRKKSGIRMTVYACVISFCAFVGLVTAEKLIGSGNTEIRIFSDGRNCLAAVTDRSGVSLFASGVTKKLSAQAYSVMTEYNTDRFGVICVTSEEKHREMFPGAFTALPALCHHCLENSEAEFDIGGRYTAHIYEDACELRINGLGIIMCDIAAADTYGPHDIAVYGRYKASQRCDMNGVTVLCDRRYSDPENAYNAYYSAITIVISSDGRYRVKEE